MGLAFGGNLIGLYMGTGKKNNLFESILSYMYLEQDSFNSIAQYILWASKNQYTQSQQSTKLKTTRLKTKSNLVKVTQS